MDYPVGLSYVWAILSINNKKNYEWIEIITQNVRSLDSWKSSNRFMEEIPQADSTHGNRISGNSQAM